MEMSMFSIQAESDTVDAEREHAPLVAFGRWLAISVFLQAVKDMKYVARTATSDVDCRLVSDALSAIHYVRRGEAGRVLESLNPSTAPRRLAIISALADAAAAKIRAVAERKVAARAARAATEELRQEFLKVAA